MPKRCMDDFGEIILRSVADFQWHTFYIIILNAKLVEEAFRLRYRPVSAFILPRRHFRLSFSLISVVEIFTTISHFCSLVIWIKWILENRKRYIQFRSEFSLALTQLTIIISIRHAHVLRHTFYRWSSVVFLNASAACDMSYRFIIQSHSEERTEYVNHTWFFFSLCIFAFDVVVLSHLCSLESTAPCITCFSPHFGHSGNALRRRRHHSRSLFTAYSFFSLRSDSETWKTTNADKNTNYRVKREWKNEAKRKLKERRRKKQIVFAARSGLYKTLRFGQKQLDERAQLCKTWFCESVWEICSP